MNRKHIELLQQIIRNGIELEIYSPDLLKRLENHYNGSDAYTAENYHCKAFLVLFQGLSVAKIHIENKLLSFEFADKDHIYPVIMETLQYLYDMRWN